MADRNGYIGRAPSDSSVTVARQVFSPTGVQTNFTFASGYVPGYLDVYLNGAKLIVAQDFSATDGSVIGLTTHATNGDVLEAVAFKAFNVATVSEASDFTVTGNQTTRGTLTVTGDTTLSNLNVTGIITAGSFSGDGSGLTGVASTDFIITGTAATFNNTTQLQNVQLVGVTTGLNVSGVATFASNVTAVDGTFTGDVTAVDGTFSGNVSVGGTLTYEDVTNIDSVGVITARTGVRVTAGGLIVTAGGVELGAGATVTGITTSTGFRSLGGTFDASTLGSGNESVSDASLVMERGNTIYVQADGYLRKVVETDGSEINIGQQNTSLINEINLRPGSATSNGVKLHAGGSGDNVRIQTTTTGAVVTGILTATSFEGSGANLTDLPASGDANDITASLFS